MYKEQEWRSVPGASSQYEDVRTSMMRACSTPRTKMRWVQSKRWSLNQKVLEETNEIDGRGE
jgi:hypothetical protein